MITTIARFVLPMLGLLLASTHAAEIPAVGSRAPDFELSAPDGGKVRLSELTATGKVVLVVLRGWPGYQCPNCDLQVNDFIRSAAAFREAKARVIFVYPGPIADLNAHAVEFQGMKGRQWPADFAYLLDPDLRMVLDYGLRWDAPRETSYPSTFVLGAESRVLFAKVSKTHGGRSTAAEVLTALR
jgi:peroxiredoxin Q/BCP